MRARISPFAALIALLVALLPSASWAQSLTLWHAYRDDERAALEQIIDGYRRAHTGVTVDVLAVPFDAYASKLESAIPHGHGPDVFIDKSAVAATVHHDHTVVVVIITRHGTS